MESKSSEEFTPAFNSDISTLRTIQIPCKIHKSVKKQHKQIKYMETSSTLDENKSVYTDKQRIKRVITSDTRKWKFSTEELSPSSQNKIIDDMNDDELFSGTSNIQFVAQQMRKKIYGYRTQDIANGIFDSERFVNLEDIVEKCHTSHLTCFYCREPVMILYEYVRDPKQWTVERIDNNYGHNHDNFEIACLSCNVRRRTIHFERYLLTKQLRHITCLREHT